MIKSNPKFICNEKGQKKKVILNEKEFAKMIEAIGDYCDYQTVQTRGNKREKIYSIEEVKKNLGMKQ